MTVLDIAIRQLQAYLTILRKVKEGPKVMIFREILRKCTHDISAKVANVMLHLNLGAEKRRYSLYRTLISLSYNLP